MLRYNDQSLVFGGVFDISGDWTPDTPRDGHKSDACGTDIDIGVLSVGGRQINAVDLARIVMTNYPGAFMINEGDDFHVHFEHVNNFFISPLNIVTQNNNPYDIKLGSH